MNEFRLTIPGEPIAKARPKLGIANGHAMAFTPQKTRRYEDIVRNIVAQQWAQPMLREVPITMHVKVYRGIPASWSKKKRALAESGQLRPIGKPDWDNFGKAISDGLNGIVYLDDALVVEARVSKRYAIEPRVEVTLLWPETDAPAVAIPQELNLIPPEPPLATRPRTPPPPDLDPKPF